MLLVTFFVEKNSRFMSVMKGCISSVTVQKRPNPGRALLARGPAHWPVYRIRLAPGCDKSKIRTEISLTTSRLEKDLCLPRCTKLILVKCHCEHQFVAHVSSRGRVSCFTRQNSLSCGH